MSFLFQNISQQFHAKLPFVLYAKSNSHKIIAVLQKDETLHFLENEADKGFVFVSFDSTKKVLIPAEKSNVYYEDWQETTYYFKAEDNEENNWEEKQKFESLVAKALQAITENQFEKVVLSRKETFAVKEIDIALIFSKMMALYPSAFKYIFYHPKIGFWVAATPERLLKTSGNIVQTVSLAGTQLFSENLTWQEKEVKEQHIVTDYITAILKPFSATLETTGPYTQKAGQLAHLKTDIKANCKDNVSIIKIINLLHPTPAVCGFPKEKALEFIVKNEGYERSFYSGFLGEWNIDFATFETKTYDLYVNLRCMQIENDVATLYVGCGINLGSNPEKEYFETVNKSKTIKKIL